MCPFFRMHVCAESGGKCYDAELNQIPEGENEMTDSTGSVKCTKRKKKVHWKRQTSGKKQRTYQLHGRNVALKISHSCIRYIRLYGKVRTEETLCSVLFRLIFNN